MDVVKVMLLGLVRVVVKEKTTVPTELNYLKAGKVVEVYIKPVFVSVTEAVF